MSLSDAAEYWWREPKPYLGFKIFYHIPNTECGHHHYHEAKKLGDVNCYDCLKLIENGYEHGLEEGKTDFRTKGEKKRDRLIELLKIENEKLGKCSCGCQRVKRLNRTTKEYFLGCSSYPKCKITSKYNIKK